MTHRERVKIVLEGGQPDFVPHFELVFFETERDFEGRTFFATEFQPDPAGRSRLDMIRYNARLYVDIAKRYDHSIVFVSRGAPTDDPDQHARNIIDAVKAVRDLAGDRYFVVTHGDATYAIPSGGSMVEWCCRLYDEPDAVKADAARRVQVQIERSRTLVEAGVDGFCQCSDYAFNDGPFLPPSMFAEFVTPYLAELTAAQRQMGAYVIKHTDGDIMPIIDQLVSANPHALHSLDPMAGVDIKEVKARYGDRIALCGNVHCAHMQTGTPEQIRASAEYAMRWGKPGGGFIFSTSNCVFRGMPLASYDLIHDIWMQHRDY